MSSIDTLKWQRILIIYQFFVQKKGKPQTIKDVEKALQNSNIEICIRDIQRYLAELRDVGILESVGSGKNLQYKIPSVQAISFYGDLYESDIFSYLFMSRILFWMFGENINIESLEKAISSSSKKAIGLHGKDLYEHLSLKIGGLLEYVGEHSAKNGNPEFLPIFIKCLLSQKKLEAEYGCNIDEAPKKIILEPWALVVYKLSLYILCPERLAEHKFQWKTFKLSRFKRVKILNESFEKKHDILKKELDRMKYSGTIWNVNSAIEKKSFVIKLRFDWYCRLSLQESLFIDNMKIIEHKEENNMEENWIEVRMKSPISKDLLTWIRSWGYNVRIIAPIELGKEMLRYGKWLCGVGN
jgi:predicted DNA-binding transcriptional regulator YafY